MYTSLASRYDPTGEFTRNFENWFDEQNAVKPNPQTPQDVLDRDEGLLFLSHAGSANDK